MLPRRIAHTNPESNPPLNATPLTSKAGFISRQVYHQNAPEARGGPAPRDPSRVLPAREAESGDVPPTILRPVSCLPRKAPLDSLSPKHPPSMHVFPLPQSLSGNCRTLMPHNGTLACRYRWKHEFTRKNVRFVVMNNVFATSLAIHHRFDLKGSTLGRHASQSERSKGQRAIFKVRLFASCKKNIDECGNECTLALRSLYISISLCVFVYVYVCVCVCARACVSFTVSFSCSPSLSPPLSLSLPLPPSLPLTQVYPLFDRSFTTFCCSHRTWTYWRANSRSSWARIAKRQCWTKYDATAM